LRQKKIYFIGQMPPIITGQSLVTETIYNLLSSKKAKIHLIEIKDKGSGIINDIIIHLTLILKILSISFSVNNVVYLPAARSVAGFFRNAYIIIFSKIFRHKIVMHFHCGDYNEFLINKGKYFILINKYIYSKVDIFIILGESLIKNYDILFNNDTEVVVIPNGIIINKKLLDTIFQNQEINILFLSNLIESKGYLDLLEAIKVLVNERGFHNIKCFFCGTFLDSSDNHFFKNKEDAKNFFFDFINDNNLSNNIIYKGLITGNEKHDILIKSDIFILPTYYSTEAQPLSILEALSYGKIVIATPHRAIPDMVIDNYNGLIIDFKSPKSIVDKIIKIIDNKSLQKYLSYNAIDFVEKNYSHIKFENNIINLFKKLEAIN